MTGTVLLTGATGFVGRQVLRALTERGARVRAVIRAGKQDRLAGRESIETVVTTPDLFAENVEWCTDVCRGIDTVIHVAWYAEPGKYLQSPKNLDCLIGTLQLAKGAALAGVRRFIGIGTCFEYDLTGGLLSVETPLRPLTPYAGTKAAAFMALSEWLPSQGVEFAWCRLFYLFGEGEDPRRLIPYLRARLAVGEPAELFNGDKVRDFLDVLDAAKMVVKVTFSDQHGPINICSGKPITIRELAMKVADEYEGHDLLIFGSRSENSLDPSCIVGVLN